MRCLSFERAVDSIVSWNNIIFLLFLYWIVFSFFGTYIDANFPVEDQTFFVCMSLIVLMVLETVVLTIYYFFCPPKHFYLPKHRYYQ